MKFWANLMAACGLAAAAILGLTVVLVCHDVIARNLGATSLPWIVELTEYALPLATLLAAPWLLFRFEHIRLDVLQQVLPPAIQRVIDRIAAAIGLVVCLVIVRYAIAVLQDSREIGAMVMKSLVFPEWWVLVPAPVCFGLMGIECARRLFSKVPGAAEHHLAPGEDS